MGEKKNGLQSVPFGVSWAITCITVYKAVIILKALRNRASCMVMHNLNVWETKQMRREREGREGGEMRVWRRQGRGKREEAGVRVAQPLTGHVRAAELSQAHQCALRDAWGSGDNQ